MRGRLLLLRQIAELRRAGLTIPWNAHVRLDQGTRLTIGAPCGMGAGSVLHAEGGTLILGDEAHFGLYNYLGLSESRIEIGDRLLCSPFVSMIAINHKIGADGLPQREQVEHEGSGIRIGDDCWLATNSVILAGVELGDGCVVGAGAVVTRSFPANTRLGGVPARPI